MMTTEDKIKGLVLIESVIKTQIAYCESALGADMAWEITKLLAESLAAIKITRSRIERLRL